MADFKIWDKPKRHSNELVNYTSYMGDNKVQIVMFDSADDMVQCVDHNIVKNEYWTAKGEESGSFTFGKDYPTLEATEKALSMGCIKDSYISDLDKVKYELLQKHPELMELERHASMKKRKRKFSDVGDELDIDRFMGGEIDMWASMPRREVPQSVKVLLNISMSAGNDYTVSKKNMVLFVAMLDILNTAGISTEVWVGDIGKASTTNTKETWNICKAKDSAEPLDISRMLTFGILGFFRYYGFAIIRNIDGGGNCEHYGLGSPQYRPNTDAKEFLGLDVIIGGTNYDANATIVVDTVKQIINPFVGDENNAGEYTPASSQFDENDFEFPETDTDGEDEDEDEDDWGFGDDDTDEDGF